MRSRLVIVVVLVVAVTAVVFAINRLTSSASPPAADPVKGPTLPSRAASYLGVYEKGPPDYLSAGGEFREVVAAQPNLVGYYSGWGEPFKTSFARTVLQHGAATIVQRDPDQISVAQDRGRPLRRLPALVRRQCPCLRRPGRHRLRARDERLLVFVGLRAHRSPKTFVAAWRHIVTLFRAQGVSNVTWLWTLQADEAGTGPIASWWPGASYVTWVGIDGYYYQPYETFASIFGPTIAQVRSLHRRAGAAVRNRSGTSGRAGARKSLTCSPGCGITGHWGSFTSTSPSIRASTTRTGGSRTAHLPWRPSAGAPRR